MNVYNITIGGKCACTRLYRQEEARMGASKCKSLKGNNYVLREKKPLIHLLNCNTSKEMFEKLTIIYGKDTDQTKCSLLQEFFNYSFVKGSNALQRESFPSISLIKM